MARESKHIGGGSILCSIFNGCPCLNFHNVITKLTLWITLVYSPTCSKTFTQGHVNVFDKYLHKPRVRVIYIYIYKGQ